MRYFELVTEEENDSSTEVSNALEAILGDHSQKVGMDFVSHINNLLVCWLCVTNKLQNQLQNSEICKNKTRTYIYSVMIQHYLITLVTLTSSPTVLQLPSSQGEVSTVPTPLVSTRVEPKAKPRRFRDVSPCFYRRS